MLAGGNGTRPEGGMNRGTFAIRRGLFLAVIDDEGIVMDIAGDRYFGLDARATAIWQELAAGNAPEWARHHIDAWRELGWLVTCEDEPPAPVPDSKPSGTVGSRQLVPPTSTSRVAHLRAAWYALRARLWFARVWKRREPVRALRDLAGRTRTRPRRRQPDLIAPLLVAFRLRRTPFGREKGDCLSRSLQLARALHDVGVDSDICFGVQKFPFRAHAWVEVGGCIAGDALSAVAGLHVIARF
jgi:hypothetical protein